MHFTVKFSVDAVFEADDEYSARAMVENAYYNIDLPTAKKIIVSRIKMSEAIDGDPEPRVVVKQRAPKQSDQRELTF